MAGADSVEKLEDVIVRSAEQVAGQIRSAKEAISTVIFGQDRVIKNTLVRSQPAPPIGAAAGESGAAYHGGRRTARSAEAVPCAGDAKSAGAGRHLSAAG